MNVAIHPTAIVDADAQLGVNVTVGPYSVIGPNVQIGDNSQIGPHCVLDGHTIMGSGNRVFPYAVIGTEPQDLKYRGSPTRVEIGDNNTIREFVLVKAGTEDGGWVTRIGNNNLLMANAHIAHDCILHDNIVMANNASLASHVTIESYAVLGGLTGVHQFVKVGAYSITGGGSLVVMDVAPFCMVAGNRAKMYGLNIVGLERHGFSENDISLLKLAHRLIFRGSNTYTEAREQIAERCGDNERVKYLIAFLDQSERGFSR